MEKEITKDSGLKTRKVERKDVDAAEKSTVSSPVEVERPTPTYQVIFIYIYMHGLVRLFVLTR